MIFDPNYKEVDIKGYEGLYKISNKGDVISLSKIRGFLKLKERIITPTIKANKYLNIKLVKNGISKHFIPNPNNLHIQWKECSCLKGIRLEDVTVELEEEAYEEMRNNK